MSAFHGEEKDYVKDESGMQISRKKTVIEKENFKRSVAASEFIATLPQEMTVKEYLPSGLAGAIFCGHLVTDLDSIAGAIGAAELYGGTPARASEINTETIYALKHWGVPKPRPIEELLVEMPQAGVCLVDHQQTSQLNKSIDVSPSNNQSLPPPSLSVGPLGKCLIVYVLLPCRRWAA